MRVHLTLAVADRPGQLLKALEPIAKHGGNIISIIHERQRTAGVYVPVSLVVDFPTYENYTRTMKNLERMGVNVTKSEEVIERASVVAILIGRLDFKRIVETKIKGLRIVGFEVSAPTSREACIKLSIDVPIESIDEAMGELKRISREENAILVASI